MSSFEFMEYLYALYLTSGDNHSIPEIIIGNTMSYAYATPLRLNLYPTGYAGSWPIITGPFLRLPSLIVCAVYPFNLNYLACLYISPPSYYVQENQKLNLRLRGQGPLLSLFC